jgi:hypothetical protein
MPRPKKAAACEAIIGHFDILIVGRTRIDGALLESLGTITTEVNEAVAHVEAIQEEIESSMEFIRALKKAMLVTNSSGVVVSDIP